MRDWIEIEWQSGERNTCTLFTYSAVPLTIARSFIRFPSLVNSLFLSSILPLLIISFFLTDSLSLSLLPTLSPSLSHPPITLSLIPLYAVTSHFTYNNQIAAALVTDHNHTSPSHHALQLLWLSLLHRRPSKKHYYFHHYYIFIITYIYLHLLLSWFGVFLYRIFLLYKLFLLY